MVMPLPRLSMGLKELNGSTAYCLDVITRVRANCIACAKPEKKPGLHRDRPCKKGNSIKVMDLFESRRHDFIASTIFMYGREQKAEYLSLNLLWGIKLYPELQFVLVKYDNVTTILATTDLNLAPTLVIEAYAHRFKKYRADVP